MVTVIIAACFLSLLAASMLLWAWLLRVGLRWKKVPDVTIRRVLLATLLVFVLQATIAMLFRFVSPADAGLTSVLGLGELVFAVLVPCLVIMRVFKASLAQAFQAWLPTLLATAATVSVVLFVVQPLVFETFIAPTNSMAPTLLGNHVRGTCLECGNPAFGSPLHERAVEKTPYLICGNEFHVTQPNDTGQQLHSPDRFAVSKFLSPRRWDIVLFRSPQRPDVLAVKRLVGLPGEEITIKDGRVWANGKMLSPPDSIGGIEYLSAIPKLPGRVWGAPGHPALLDDDEFFVLGDFSLRSQDSRFWPQGPPGHHSYALPAENVVGVVSHIYWPPERWRAFR